MGYAHFMIVGKQEIDLRFGRYLAAVNGLPFHSSTDAQKIRHILVDHPQTIVLLDADDPDFIKVVEDTLIKFSSPPKVFAVTDGPINDYPHLVASRVFGHHMFRRYDKPAPLLTSKLIAAAISPFPFGLQRYFPSGTTCQKILVKKSGQKLAAVQAIQNYLNKIAVTTRLSALIAQATDELIMNAIFDAPVTQTGAPLRRGMARDTEFDLEEREYVELELATAESYVGIAVGDTYGSLKKEAIHRFLGLDYNAENYVVKKSDPSAGLGIHGIIQAGVSMVFVCKPGTRTEVMLFFPAAENFKDFRKGFRFVSILSQ